MTAALDITVAICTRDRPASLARTLASVRAQEGFGGTVEVLVVDNASADPGAVAGAVAACPGARLAEEAVPGLSHARNRALAQARGRWILFVDDDAAMHYRHLASLGRVLAEEDNAGAVGGPVALGWDAAVPTWYSPGLDRFLNHLDLGPCRRDIRYPHVLYGTNVAYEADLVRSLGGFDPLFGRAPGSFADSEEVALQLAVEEQAKARVIYDPGLGVTHFATNDRLNPGRLLAMAHGHGRSIRAVEARYPRRAMPHVQAACLVLSLARTLIHPTRPALPERLIRASVRGYFGVGRKKPRDPLA